MALIECPECKHAISDRALSCPSCGLPLSPSPSLEPSELNSARKLTTAKPPPPPQQGNEPNSMKAVGRALDEMSHGQQPVHESPAVAAEGKASEPRAGDSTTTDTAPASDARRKRYGRATVSIIPLILMVLWIWQVGTTANQNGSSEII